MGRKFIYNHGTSMSEFSSYFSAGTMDGVLIPLIASVTGVKTHCWIQIAGLHFDSIVRGTAIYSY